MTSQQILQSDMLDILFEKRNKLYGAYWLRTHYNNHLLKAIGGTTLAIGCLLFFVSPSSSVAGKKVLRDEFKVVQVVIPEQKKPEPIRPKVAQPLADKLVSQDKFLDKIKIVEQPIDPIATQSRLALSNIGSTNVQGPFIPGVQPPEPPSIITADVSTPPQKDVILITRQPQFPGGSAAWLRFLERYLQAPQELEAGERKMVLVKFSVDEEGNVTGFQVVQSGGTVFDNEVIRVLKKMPKWMPALQSGKPIAVSFTQPVTFAAQDE